MSYIMSAHPIAAKVILTTSRSAPSCEQTYRIRHNDVLTHIKVEQYPGFITLTSMHDIACDISFYAHGSADKLMTASHKYVLLASIPTPIRNPPACRVADLWIEPIPAAHDVANPSAVIKGLEDAIDYYSDFLELLVPYTKELCRRADEYASSPERIAERAAADKYWKLGDAGYVADASE